MEMDNERLQQIKMNSKTSYQYIKKVEKEYKERSFGSQ